MLIHRIVAARSVRPLSWRPRPPGNAQAVTKVVIRDRSLVHLSDRRPQIRASSSMPMQRPLACASKSVAGNIQNRAAIAPCAGDYNCSPAAAARRLRALEQTGREAAGKSQRARSRAATSGRIWRVWRCHTAALRHMARRQDVAQGIKTTYEVIAPAMLIDQTANTIRPSITRRIAAFGHSHPFLPDKSCFVPAAAAALFLSINRAI